MTKTTLENLIHRYEREYDKLYAARSTGTDYSINEQLAGATA